MAVSRRAVVVVMDACGVGALPDAAEYEAEGKRRQDFENHHHCYSCALAASKE